MFIRGFGPLNPIPEVNRKKASVYNYRSRSHFIPGPADFLVWHPSLGVPSRKVRGQR
jgi:hypothetical protein